MGISLRRTVTDYRRLAQTSGGCHGTVGLSVSRTQMHLTGTDAHLHQIAILLFLLLVLRVRRGALGRGRLLGARGRGTSVASQGQFQFAILLSRRRFQSTDDNRLTFGRVNNLNVQKLIS